MSVKNQKINLQICWKIVTFSNEETETMGAGNFNVLNLERVLICIHTLSHKVFTPIQASNP